MGKYPTGPDPSTAPTITSMGDPGPIVIFVWWGVVLVCLSSFLIGKRMILKRRKAAPLYLYQHQIESHPEGHQMDLTEPIVDGSMVLKDLKPAAEDCSSESRLDMEEHKALRFQGYKETLYGRFCYLLCLLMSLQWVALLVVLLYDYYAGCQVGGIDNWCFYGSNPIFGTFLFNGQIFFVVWILNAAWFTSWIALKGRVRNLFRLQCAMGEASIVVVWAPNESEILSANVVRLVLWFRRLKDRLSPPNMRGTYTTVPIRRSRGGQKFFLHQGIRFLVKDGSVYRASFSVGEDYADFHSAAKGLSSDEAGVRMDDVGVNEIPFRTDTLYELVSNEFITFFYGYQWVFYQLWFWFSYLFVAIIMSSVVLLSAVVNIWLTHRSQVAIAKISEYITDVEVLRDGEWVRLDSRMLLPGDVVRLPSDWLLPADFVIIQGQAVCNESALTGEAMPVQKYQCPNENQRYSSTSHAGSRHTLYAGTTLLQAGSRPQDEVLAVVSATGMSTSKGDLLSAILYPQRMIFKYDEELVVVVILMITYAAVCAILSVVFQVIKGQQSVWVTKWVYMVFIISQILSPILPVALNVGQMNAMERLKKKGINCLNAKRIAISGKIRVFCFDKTGTLTRDGLDFLGAKAADGGAFGDLLTPADSSSAAGIPPSVMNGLATCHAVSRFGDAYVGNQVEVRMFEATGWQLMETSGQDPRVVDTSGKTELTIVKRFEFDHARATMSVVVRDAAGQHFVYCKGSFEKIREVSQPESLPESYLQTAQGLALEGCYVLGMSTKSLGSIRSEEATSLSRNAVEEGLSFSSLLVFRNELKPDTRDAIIDLKSGAVRPVMITGDNAQCGQYVAKASGMTHPECPIYLAEMTGDGSVKWSLTGQENAGSAAVSTEELIGGHIKELQAGSLELAVTGKAFQALRSTADMQYLLFFCRIFARVTPEEKVQVCNLFRDAGLVIGMAGDGGNDCGALRAAHAGVALSDAEASVVSPFTSKSKSVRSVVDLLREGRGALHTSFAAVKFLVIYGLNFSVLKLGSYWYGIIVCSFMYLSIDAFAVLTLGYALTLSHPAKKLNKMRPTSSLIGPLHVASVFGYFVISLGYLVGALYLMQSDKNYVPWPTRLSQGASWWTLGDNWESTILFFTLYFNFLSAAFIFTFGSTFRRTVFRNWVLIGFYVFLMTFYSWLLLSKPNSATRYYHIASQQFNAPGVTAADSPVWTVYQEQGGQPSPAMSMAFRWKFWGLCMGNVITLIIWQKGVAEGLVSGWMRKRFPSKRPVFNY